MPAALCIGRTNRRHNTTATQSSRAPSMVRKHRFTDRLGELDDSLQASTVRLIVNALARMLDHSLDLRQRRVHSVDHLGIEAFLTTENVLD
jgi:hypothetical protein